VSNAGRAATPYAASFAVGVVLAAILPPLTEEGPHQMAPNLQEATMSQRFWTLVGDRYIDGAGSMILHGWATHACDGVAYEIWPSRPQEHVDDVVTLTVILDDESAIELGRFGSYDAAQAAAQARFDERSIE
jgi:hypothetical protein